MKYQNIPFYIASNSKNTSAQIGKMLGREAKTVLTTTNIPEFFAYLKTCDDYTCFVFQISGQNSTIESMIKAVYQKNPNFPIILISFNTVTLEELRYYLQLGVTDILISGQDVMEVSIIDDLLKSLNLKWRAYLHTFKENDKVYQATVVTANHEINQPLTVILNAIGLLSAELIQITNKEPRIKAHLDFISKGTKRIQLILEKLKNLKKIKLKEYTPGVPMINLEQDPIPVPKIKKIKVNYKDTILLVEQNLTESGLIENEIKKMGLETITAKSLKEAEVFINRMMNKIQAIMFSSSLPANELENTLFELNSRKDYIPIILIKNEDTSPENTKLMDSCAFQVLHRPINARSLQEAITNSVLIVN